LSVSVGVSSYDKDSACWVETSPATRFAAIQQRDASDLVRSADKALYCAKEAGRGCARRLGIDEVDSPPDQDKEIVLPSRVAA
jgi:GGDEF domain-containing protein